MRLLLLLVALTGLLAALPPTAAACPTPETCVGEIEVCLSATPWFCARIDPDDAVSKDRISEIVRQIIGPCTCDPID